MSSNDPRQPSVPFPGSERPRDRDREPEREARAAGIDGPGDIAPHRGRSSAPTPPPAASHGSAAAAGPPGASTRGTALVALLLGVLLGAFAMVLVDVIGDRGDGDPFDGRIDENGYQAVILSNDKVYFGRIRSVSDTFFELDDAFFLRETRANADAEPVRTLLRVNSELHGPENRMLIRKDEVVLVENLADDSPVLREIARQADEGDEASGDSGSSSSSSDDDEGTTSSPSTTSR